VRFTITRLAGSLPLQRVERRKPAGQRLGACGSPWFAKMAAGGGGLGSGQDRGGRGRWAGPFRFDTGLLCSACEPVGQRGVVEDLIALQHLVEQEADVARRRSLDAVRRHVAERDQGAKIAEAAMVLAVSAPTVRAWTEAGAVRAIPGARPARVDVMSLAAAKQVLDELRRHTDDPQLLADVLRVLRDRADLTGEEVHSATSDVVESRVRRLDRRGLDQLLPPNG